MKARGGLRSFKKYELVVEPGRINVYQTSFMSWVDGKLANGDACVLMKCHASVQCHAVPKDPETTTMNTPKTPVPYTIKTSSFRPRLRVVLLPCLFILDIPVPRGHLLLKFLGVLVPQLSSLTIEWGRVVGLAEQRLQAEENGLDIVGGCPLVL